MTYQNRLAHESSAYLLQHANNPVDWYPWTEEALTKAKKEDKPILLSIGYSACHWCHVMAHESFEDIETAKLMNQCFICIKVDREERPDLDKIYQSLHQFQTRTSGGWPLTVFLSPRNLIPFFSGTYFPIRSQYGLPSFKKILLHINDLYQDNKKTIELYGLQIQQMLKTNFENTSFTHQDLNFDPYQKSLSYYTLHHDKINGGFGFAPKFPPHTALAFLYQNKSPIVPFTLEKMCRGGIYDHIGGGFFRYSVDERWEIPHFEKMLYDNGQLLEILSKVIVIKHDIQLQNAAIYTANWIMRDMQDSSGGYYASIDADSEIQEGKYYVWDKKEIQHILLPAEFAIAKFAWGLDKNSNFDGRWHLNRYREISNAAEYARMTIKEAQNHLESARKKLRDERLNRLPPFKDKKILCSWNSLAIKGMLSCGIALSNENYINSAFKALNYIYCHLWNGHELKSLINSKHSFLDDYAYLIDAILLSLEVRWQTRYLYWIIQLLNILLRDFYDENNGGFYFSTSKETNLLFRYINFHDEQTPSGNALAIKSFIIIGYLLGDTHYINVAEKSLQRAFIDLQNHEESYCTLLLALKEFLEPSNIVIVRTDQDIPKKTILSKSQYCFTISNNETNLPPALNKKKAQPPFIAYVCHGSHCEPPLDSQKKLTDFILGNRS